MQAQVELCRLRSAHLESLLACAQSADQEETLARRLDGVLISSHTAQLMLALLERQVKEADSSLESEDQPLHACEDIH